MWTLFTAIVSLVPFGYLNIVVILQTPRSMALGLANAGFQLQQGMDFADYHTYLRKTPL